MSDLNVGVAFTPVSAAEVAEAATRASRMLLYGCGVPACIIQPAKAGIDHPCVCTPERMRELFEGLANLCQIASQQGGWKA